MIPRVAIDVVDFKRNGLTSPLSQSALLAYVLLESSVYESFAKVLCCVVRVLNEDLFQWDLSWLWTIRAAPHPSLT